MYDALNDREIVLTDEELRIIQRIRKGEFAPSEFDPYAEFGDTTAEKHVEVGVGDLLGSARSLSSSVSWSWCLVTRTPALSWSWSWCSLVVEMVLVLWLSSHPVLAFVFAWCWAWSCGLGLVVVVDV